MLMLNLELFLWYVFFISKFSFRYDVRKLIAIYATRKVFKICILDQKEPIM